jgi:hypothetical protein
MPVIEGADDIADRIDGDRRTAEAQPPERGVTAVCFE